MKTFKEYITEQDAIKNENILKDINNYPSKVVDGVKSEIKKRVNAFIPKKGILHAIIHAGDVKKIK